MTIKVFFDTTWTGPLVAVDANGKKTSGGDDTIKGELQSAIYYTIELP